MQTFEQNLDCHNDKHQLFSSPNSELISTPMNTSPVCGKKVDLDFNGGSMTSDAGVLILSEIERNCGIIKSLSSCIDDTRRTYSIDHSTEEILAQRVYQISCGYEDANDSDSLRKDPAIKMAVGHLPIQGDDLASQPTISRLENRITDSELEKMKDVFMDHFIASYDEEPEVIVLDFDDTHHVVHGHQQMALFNSYYHETCYMPLHVYEGMSGNFITAILRPGKRSSGKETVGYLKSIVERIRTHWENTIIVFRGDGHFSSPEVFDYIATQENMYSIAGLTSNKKLLNQAQTTINSAKKLYDHRQAKVKLYHSFYYQAGSWSHARKVVVKVEMSDYGLNVRFISTDMVYAKTKALYEMIYCGRGSMELRIKDHKTYTKSDRTSCHSFKANQFRLFLHSAAYVLLHALRTQLLKGTELANATLDTLRLKLLKIGARVVEMKTKIKIHLPTAYPLKRLLKKCLDILKYLYQSNSHPVSPVLLC